MNERVAIIDLGTNTFHLMVASGMDILHRERVPVKIGMGSINRDLIPEQGLERALAALQGFRKTMDAYAVAHTFAFATSAIRSASNREAVIARIRHETAIDVTVITGDAEAAFIYYGVRAAMELGTAPSLILDIGGGSVEFIIASREKIYWKESYNIGAQRLLEQFQQHDPIAPGERAALDGWLGERLGGWREAMQAYRPSVLIGSSGTFDTLSEIYCLRADIPYSETQPETPLTFAAFRELFSEFLRKDRAERMRIPGMIEMRVDMIVVACCLIDHVMNAFPFDGVRVSTWSMKEGVLSRFNEGAL